MTAKGSVGEEAGAVAWEGDDDHDTGVAVAEFELATEFVGHEAADEGESPGETDLVGGVFGRLLRGRRRCAVLDPGDNLGGVGASGADLNETLSGGGG